MTVKPPPVIPQRADEAAEIDYSGPIADEFEALSRDKVPVRSLDSADLAALISIDRKITGRDRRVYFEERLEETLEQSAIRVSLVAELNGRPVGFIMARVDFGEFGRAEPEAVIDTIGVEPLYGHMEIGSALLSQLLTNLAALHVLEIRTELAWDEFALMSFLAHAGFRPSQRLALRRSI
jgi:ribosomal protein S18 acetylase RimI-like enzyme